MDARESILKKLYGFVPPEEAQRFIEELYSPSIYLGSNFYGSPDYLDPDNQFLLPRLNLLIQRKIEEANQLSGRDRESALKRITYLFEAGLSIILSETIPPLIEIIETEAPSAPINLVWDQDLRCILAPVEVE